MAKSGLNRRQKQRIEKRRTVASPDLTAETEPLVEGDRQPGLVIAHYGSTLEVELPGGERLRCHVRSHLQDLVVGDRVELVRLDDETGIVVAQEPRKSQLQRPDTRGQLRTVAANLDQIIIVAAAEPETSMSLVDRYLVSVHSTGLKPILVFNKMDLAGAEHPFYQYIREYRDLGYQVIAVSVQQDANGNESLEKLRDLMRDKTSILVGQSGVGKSTLTNRLIPGLDIKTTEISDATGKGRHTTTRSELFHLPGGGSLIDSPGVREFGLWHLDENQLYTGFVELEDLPGCKFRNCRHGQEPGCALKQAVEQGQMLPRRFDSLLAIRDSLNEVDMHN